MPGRFIKHIDCGCVVIAIMVGVETTENRQRIMLGGHQHLTICDKCRILEDSGDDTLYDMWMNDAYAYGDSTDDWIPCSDNPYIINKK